MTTRIYLVKYTDGTTGFLDIPKSIENIVQSLDLNILPISISYGFKIPVV
ncbi:MAG: hypothetical protein QW292_04765 [Candidatus Parvarchaeota archaeon]